MRAGFERADITPPDPLPLGGFAARSGPALGVHDPLMCQMALLEVGGESLVIAALDHLGLSSREIAPLRGSISKVTGVPVSNVWIHCTHTHGAPEQNENYLGFLCERLADAASRLTTGARESQVFSGEVPLRGRWFYNRRALLTGFDPVDNTITVTAFCNGDDITGLICSASCHPACLGPDNRCYTADWPGFFRQKLGELLPGNPSVVFLHGASGDVNTGYSAGISALGRPVATRNFPYAEAMGSSLAGEVVAALSGLQPMAAGSLRIGHVTVDAVYRADGDLGELDERRKMLNDFLQKVEGTCSRDLADALRIEITFLGFERQRRERQASQGKSSLLLELSAACLGHTFWVTFPGEFFVESALSLKREFPGKTVHCASMTNDYQGYFPPAGSLAEGGYEPKVARFMPGTAESCVESVLGLARRLGVGQGPSA